MRRSLDRLIQTSVCLLILANLSQFACAVEDAKKRNLPNIVWLSTEDIGPHLGCYGDPDAVTPNLDAFAKRSLTYDVAWSNYPVCAPARTTIIAGMYASSNAAGNMRSSVQLPAGVEMFPHYLREAGYYCTNNSKTDYNYKSPQHDPWDESSNQAHWRNRKTDQPFFAVFNHTGTHESKIRARPHESVIDPASVTLPPYWPDQPEVRQDWAQYHDNITRMDGWFQRHMKALESAGLADNTIVVFFGDHGSGMPRHKRFAGDSGMLVPFIVHVPDALKDLAPAEYKTGGRSQRPVGFIDLAPTMLSAAGIKPPSYMQGHAFLGTHQTEAPEYAYGFRDRMDERPDISRSIRDQQFIYVRNYMPHLPAGQHVGYQFETSTTSVWKRMFDENELNDVQAHFWRNHPPEELYDLNDDPHETKNLVDNPAFKAELQRFRDEHESATFRFGDLGLIPEPIAAKFGSNQSRRSMLEDSKSFPMKTIFEVANLAANYDLESVPDLAKALEHDSASVRYWGALGLLIRGEETVNANLEILTTATKDSEPCVSIVACEALGRFGNVQQQKDAVAQLTEFSDVNVSDFYSAILALNSLERVKQNTTLKAVSYSNLPQPPEKSGRGMGYIKQLIDHLKAQ